MKQCKIVEKYDRTSEAYFCPSIVKHVAMRYTNKHFLVYSYVILKIFLQIQPKLNDSILFSPFNFNKAVLK